MGIVLFACAVSVALAATICVVAWSRFGLAGALVACAVGVVPGLFIVSQAILMQVAISFVAVLLCALLHLGAKTVALASTTAALLSCGLAFVASVDELRERQELRAQYPLESLTEQLGYEQHQYSEPEWPSSAAIPLNAEVERELTQFEEDMPGHSYRSYELNSLHSAAVDEFVMARGFGFIRMGRVTKKSLELPQPKPIRPPAEPVYSPDNPPPFIAADDQQVETPGKELLTTLHLSGVYDFLDPQRMGYVQDRDHVAGFLPHQFSRVPTAEVPERRQWNSPFKRRQKDNAPDPLKESWQVVRVDLISLLKHEVPVAYVSEHLPRMEELENAPSRPLNTFEQQSLERLRTDEDVVTETAPDRIFMLGSLRAGKSCLSCHSVRRGELLGAFSYELAPAQPRSLQPETPSGNEGGDLL